MKKSLFILLTIFSLISTLFADDGTGNQNHNVDFGINDSVLSHLATDNELALDEINLISQFEELDILKNIEDMSLDGLSATFSGNTLKLHNIRILSDSTTFKDYLTVEFLINAMNLKLIPTNLTMTQNLGMYYRSKAFFSKDANKKIVLTTPYNQILESDKLHEINCNENSVFKMDLITGMVLTLRSSSPSDEYMLKIEKPDGSKYLKSIYRKDSNWYITSRAIFDSGVYKFRFIPQNSRNVKLKFGFTNNNRKVMRNITSGNKIRTSLNGWGNEYAKYQLSLKTGDTINIDDPTDDNVYLYLINSKGVCLANGSGEIYQKVYYNDTFYLFIRNSDYKNGASYSGKVKITPDKNIDNYPFLRKVENQTIKANNYFTLQLYASNSPTKYYSVGLPNGIDIDSQSGIISGKTSLLGKFLIKVYAENEYGFSQEHFQLKVKENTISNSAVSGNFYIEDSPVTQGNAMLIQSGELHQKINFDQKGNFYFERVNKEKPFSVILRRIVE